MPRYDYQCPNEHEYEGYRSLSEHDQPVVCPTCGELGHKFFKPGASIGIASDDIPGGIVIKHGQGLEGKKFYSKTELKRVANEHGWCIAGDTPKPYRVHWSGVQKSQAGLPIKNRG